MKKPTYEKLMNNHRKVLKNNKIIRNITSKFLNFCGIVVIKDLIKPQFKNDRPFKEK